MASSTYPNIAMVVHQVAYFSIILELLYKKAILRIGMYLAIISKYKIYYNIDIKWELEVFVNINFDRS